MGVVRSVLRSLVGETTSRQAENADASVLTVREVAGERLRSTAEYTLEDPRLDEVVRLVQAVVPTATVEAIREYVKMLDNRRQVARKLAERSIIERLPDPKPSTLGQRLGQTPEILAEEIIDALRHERR